VGTGGGHRGAAPWPRLVWRRRGRVVAGSRVLGAACSHPRVREFVVRQSAELVRAWPVRDVLILRHA
jgi:hypothetical protein